MICKDFPQELLSLNVLVTNVLQYQFICIVKAAVLQGTEIFPKMYLIENKEVTSLCELNR
ncbi:hypothetical protein JCM15124A_11930 [Prevotella falsenii]